MVSERLRLARIECGLNLHTAARFLEMPARRLSDIEMGREEPPIYTVERMYRVYGYFDGLRIAAGRDLTRDEIESAWYQKSAEREREQFWRGSPRRA